MKATLTIAALVCGFVVAGCGRTDPSSSSTPAAVPEVSAELAAVFRPVPVPETLLSIPAFRDAVQPGDEVVFEAKVMGTETPFVEGRALVVVGDEGTLTSCNLRPGDTCETPWDVCCDDPKAIRAGTATVQVVDQAGQVIKTGLRGAGGLQELSRVRVAGVVAPQATGDALIINAHAIEVL
jgi:hypothetical protein